MLKKSKLINIICGLMIGVIFMIAVVVVLIVTGLLSFSKVNLVVETDSVQAMYDGTPLTNHSWKISQGALKNGHELKVTYKGTQTVVGESDNVIEISVFDELGADVTSDYNITYKFGTLKVDPRILIITSDSAEKLYDGSPLVASGYEIDESCDGLVKGHIENVTVTGYIVEPGKTNNTIYSVKVYDVFGEDVTRNYRLVLREGLLVINSKSNGGGGGGNGDGDGGGNGGGDTQFPGEPDEGDISLKDEAVDPETVLFTVYSDESENVYLRFASYGDYTGRGWNSPEAYYDLINGKYSASYLPALMTGKIKSSRIQIVSHCGQYALPYYMTTSGGHEIQQNDVVFEGKTDGVIYNVEYYEVVKSRVENGYYADYEIGYRDFVYNTYLNIDEITQAYMEWVIEANGFDSSDPEILEKVANFIKNSAAYNLDYPKEMDEENNVAIAFLETYKEGVCRHYASAATLLLRALGIPARYTVGALAVTSAGEWTDVRAKQAHAWVEVYIDGLGWTYLEVTGSEPEDNREILEVKPETVRKRFDGTPCYTSGIIVGLESLAERGYTYSITVSGERTEPGISESKIESIEIYNQEGENVTDQFNIHLKPGIIQVYIDVLYLQSADVEKVYDGKNDSVIFVSDEYKYILGDYMLEATSTASTDIGTNLNLFSVKIVDENGDDQTDKFLIVKKYGSLNIVPAEIAVKAGDAQKAYDGEPLTCEEYTIEEGSLCEGHYIAMCIIVGSQTELGRSDNNITYIEIYDQNGKNVTSNYTINCLAGKLRVTWN